MQERMLKINWRCMGLTEFDNLMKALADEKEVPKELNLKLKKKIRAKYNYKKLMSSIPLSAVACIAVGIVLVSAVNRNEENFVVPPQVVSETIISEEIHVEDEPVITEKKEIKEIKETKENKKEKVKKSAIVETKETEPPLEPVNDGIEVAQIEPSDLSGIEPMPINEDAAPMSRARMIEEDDIEERSLSLIEYLANDEEKVSLVSQRIKEQMQNNEEIDYYDSFTSISGNERYDVTVENELVVFFDAGVVAPEEFGEQVFNLGVIN